MVKYALYEEVEFRQERLLRNNLIINTLKQQLILRLLTINEQDLADEVRSYSGDDNRWFGPYHVVKEID